MSSALFLLQKIYICTTSLHSVIFTNQKNKMETHSIYIWGIKRYFFQKISTRSKRLLWSKQRETRQFLKKKKRKNFSSNVLCGDNTEISIVGVRESLQSITRQDNYEEEKAKKQETATTTLLIWLQVRSRV